jgi:hypothetical protein
MNEKGYVVTNDMELMHLSLLGRTGDISSMLTLRIFLSFVGPTVI